MSRGAHDDFLTRFAHRVRQVYRQSAQAASAAGAATGATGNAAAPEAASGTAESPPLDLNGGPETTLIPAGQLVPPTRFTFPSFKLR